MNCITTRFNFSFCCVAFPQVGNFVNNKKTIFSIPILFRKKYDSQKDAKQNNPIWYYIQDKWFAYRIWKLKDCKCCQIKSIVLCYYARIFLYIKWLNLPIFSTHWTLELSGYPTAQTFSEIRELVQYRKSNYI